jgi:hypothetical protein
MHFVILIPQIRKAFLLLPKEGLNLESMGNVQFAILGANGISKLTRMLNSSGIWN